MPEENYYEVINTLRIPSSVFTQIQDLGENLAEKMNYLQSYDFTSVSKSLTQIQDMMQPLVNLYPQLDNLNQVLQSFRIPEKTFHLSLSQISSSEVHRSISEIESELYDITETFVDKALSYEIVQDIPPQNLPDNDTLQNVMLIVAYYATTLTPHDLIEWAKQLLKFASSMLQAAGGLSLNGISNIKMMLDITQWICESIRSIL